MFSSVCFIVSGCLFKSLINFELIFLYGVRGVLSFSCMWLSSFSNIMCWRDFPFNILCFGLPCRNLVAYLYVGLFLGSEVFRFLKMFFCHYHALLFLAFLKIILLFNYSCLHFLPTPAKTTSLPYFHPPPWFYPCVLFSSSWKPFSPLSFPSTPLAIVRLFYTSLSLVIFCELFFFW